MPDNPKISIVIPIYEMKNGAFFLWRAINSIMKQTFKDYEIIITRERGMAENTNAGIKKARGQLIKILYMDDWLEDNNYLQTLYRAFEEGAFWAITSATTNSNPHWTDDIETGNNKLGSPSALAFRNGGEANLLFDENLSWLLDCDYYKRMYAEYGRPAILTNIKVGIGIHDGQVTNLMSDSEKLEEHKYLKEKYAD